VASWKDVVDHNISELRQTEVLDRFTAVTHLQRATGRVVKSLMTDHGASRRPAALACNACCARQQRAARAHSDATACH
jgi:hypothetical protein